MRNILVVTTYINYIISCVLFLANLPIAGFIVFLGVCVFVQVIDDVYREREIMDMLDEWDTLLKRSQNSED